ncbi:PREDICTED: ubiquitin carboxyl-terminal hydrolase 26 [Chrysochloris asiatica]|uniref:Ubiquitin carboxyl-terminal hydrolase n=1 Tax=Chrysochloris asiatica TaxID=185453 RepID=A0A9B0WQ67_CHRAS|nr:PREDICTED: ubiquitin carboxyl-terminal hydrolase 26 [Chrysochloris asiatica]
MTTLLVAGCVQVWNKKKGMSKSEEAFIEIVEEVNSVNLVIHFSNSNQIKTFQLTNNIRNVVFRSHGENQNHLHVTFQNNNFLFINKLSYNDASSLKMLLDMVQNNELQPSMQPVRGEGDQCETKELLDQKCKEPHSESSQSDTGSAAPVPQETPSTAHVVTVAATNLEEWKGDEVSLQFSLEKHKQGLPNLGNTCYMNAILQSLFAIPSFVDDLLHQSIQCGKIPFRGVTLCVAQLFVLRNVCDLQVKEKMLVNIKKAISTVADIFSEDTENDSHEFLVHCLDQIKENVSLLRKIWEKEQASGEKVGTEMLICPVTSNFEFELQRSIVCKGCGQIVYRTELSNYLSINLPQPSKSQTFSIQTALDLYFAPEELEYTCEKCEHKCSVALYKFSKVPRVLIVHLKRYNFNEGWFLKKDEHVVLVPKYLHLSSHCNESTTLPSPPENYVHVWDPEAKMVSEETIGGDSQLKSSTTLASESKDSKASCSGSVKQTRSQKGQKGKKGSRKKKKHQGLEKGHKLNLIESDVRGSIFDAVSEDQVIVGDAKLYHEDIISLLLQEFGSEFFISSPGEGLEEDLKHGPENPEPTQFKEADISSELPDFVTIQVGSEGVPGEPHSFEAGRVCDPEKPLSPSAQKPDTQEHTENVKRRSKRNVQGAKMKSQVTVCSSKEPKKIDRVLSKEEREARDKKREMKTQKRGPYAYRLISIVSHLGRTLHSGHYISDIYDFRKRIWYTFSDLRVAVLSQNPVKKGGRHTTGYIFFYMHNEIFEELMKREEKAKIQSTEARENPKPKPQEE